VLDAWEALSGQTRVLLLRHRTLNPRDFEERAVEWHRRLAAALRQRDLQRAQRELRKHLAVTVEGLINGADGLKAAEEDGESGRLHLNWSGLEEMTEMRYPSGKRGG